MRVRLQLSILGCEQGSFHSISTGQYHTHPFHNNKQMQDPTFIHCFPSQVGFEMFNLRFMIQIMTNETILM